MATSADFSKSVTAASDEVKDIYCEPCADDGKQTAAEGFCVDCSEYLCGQCYKNHKRYKAFKHHVLQDKNTMPLDITQAGVKDVGVKDFCVEKCAVHSPKVIEYFCGSCDKLGCTACITINHRQCKNVDHIPSIVKEPKTLEEFQTFKSALEEHLDAVNERKKTITETDEIKRNAKAELKKQQEEIRKFFHNLELEMERRIEEIDKINKETLKAAETTYNSINDELKQMKTDTDTKLKNEQKCQLFIAMKKYQPKMDQIGIEFKKLETETKIKRYGLTTSSKVKNVMKNTSEICRLITAKFLSEVNVCTDDDEKRPTVTGHAIVQNHFLALTDTENRSVKVFDTKKMSLTSEMDIRCLSVEMITSVQDSQIAVVVKNGRRKIYIFSVSTSGSLSKDYHINIGYECYGLAYSREKLFIVRTKKIEVTDMHGKLLKTIETQYYGHIVVSPDHETIYMTISYTNSVISMTMQGKIKTTYQDTDLKLPEGITVDNESLVYVRSHRTSTIHQLTEDLKKVQILIENEPSTTITYSNTENRLYLGWSNMIKVYQME